MANPGEIGNTSEAAETNVDISAGTRSGTSSIDNRASSVVPAPTARPQRIHPSCARASGVDGRRWFASSANNPSYAVVADRPEWREPPRPEHGPVAYRPD